MSEAEIFQLAVETVISAATMGFGIGLLILFFRPKK
jgi:hypothetical protein